MSDGNLKLELVPVEDSQYSSPIISIIEEIYISEIPTDYIDYIEVEFKNGLAVYLESDEIKNPFRILSEESVKNTSFENISVVRIFVDFDKLERDVDSFVDVLFYNVIFPDD